MTLPAGWEDSNIPLVLKSPGVIQTRPVYVLPAPYEHTSSYILGSMKALRPSLKLLTRWSVTDETLRCEPFREWGGIATVAPLELKGKIDREAVDAIEQFVHSHIGNGRFLVTLTGEHTGALGAIRAHAKRYPDMSVVQIDAHGDLRHAYQDNLYSHASVMARRG